MNRFRALIAAFAVLYCAAAAANPLRIGIAAEPYPPFTIKQSNGQWSGFEVELVRKLCQRLKQSCQIAEVSWDGIIPALNSKKIDVIFNSMSITPEREKSSLSACLITTPPPSSSAPRARKPSSARPASRARPWACNPPPPTPTS